MKGIILTAICICALILPVRALNSESVMDIQKEELQLKDLEREAERQLEGMNIKIEYDLEKNIASLVRAGMDQLLGILKRAIPSCAAMLAIILFCSLSEGVLETGGGGSHSVVTMAGTLAVSAVAVTDLNALLGLGIASIASIASFSKVLLPVVASLTAATGAITGAYARQMAAALFSSVLINLIDSVLVPLVYGFVAASIASTATGNTGLKRVASIFKWVVVTLLTAMLLVYIGYLTLSGVIAGSADAASVKAAKFAISSAVPVVGGILADASESVLAASGILRSSVGVFGMIVVLGICLVPFLRLGVHYLAYKGTAAMTAMLGGGPISELIESLSSAFGLILGMMGACALMLLIALVSSVMVVTA